jgi:hypothetical protein
VPKRDRIVETVETWGIRPYAPDLDSRLRSDPARIRDEARYARGCLDVTCRDCRLNPIAEMADERDEASGVVDSTDRVRLFAAAWKDYKAWKAAEVPEFPGVTNLLGETEEGAQKHALSCLMMVGAAIPMLRPWRQQTPGSATDRVRGHGR